MLDHTVRALSELRNVAFDVAFNADVNQGQQNGMFNRHQWVNISGVTDGTSNTFAVSERIATDQGGEAGSQTELSRIRKGQSVKPGYNNPRAWSMATSPLTKADLDGWGQACAAITSINGNRVGDKWFHGEPARAAHSTLLTPNSNFPNCSFHCSGRRPALFRSSPGPGGHVDRVGAGELISGLPPRLLVIGEGIDGEPAEILKLSLSR
ncbi:MAG: DUF1559 domain-containing protein [Maioricimonas sp. JB049]